jgi:hypothetical protein
MDQLALVTLLLGILERAAAVGALINKARAEGRDISAAELEALVDADDAAREALVKAIADAKAEGR